MPWTFNPFSGTFDQKGSGGGGGASYIDGEVAVYADLSLSSTTAPLNSAWLVRTASGVWPVTRKQGGIYIRTATGGSNRDSDYTYAGTMPDVFSDSQFLLYDNSDTSKNLAFDLGSISAGQTRTLTVPDASGRIQIEGQAIGNTTPAAGTFTTLASSSDATLNGFVIGATSIAPTTGNRNYETANGNGLVGVTSGAALAAGTNAPRFAAFSNNRCGMRVEGEFGWASAGAPSSSNFDLILRRDAAGVLAQYNGTNAQTFRIYNTFTDANNHERGFLKWSSNVFQIGTEKGSVGGTARALEFQTDGVTRFALSTAGVATFTATNTLTVTPNTTSTLVGGAAAVRLDAVRIAIATGGTDRLAFSGGGDAFFGSTLIWNWSSRTRFSSPADGQFLIQNSAGTDFNRIQFGGTTSSFPALKRSSTVLQSRLADDSDFAPMQGQLRIHQNAVSETITATHTLTLFDAAGTAYKVPCVAA
jgi:hypothetical protein